MLVVIIKDFVINTLTWRAMDDTEIPEYLAAFHPEFAKDFFQIRRNSTPQTAIDKFNAQARNQFAESHICKTTQEWLEFMKARFGVQMAALATQDIQQFGEKEGINGFKRRNIDTGYSIEALAWSQE